MSDASALIGDFQLGIASTFIVLVIFQVAKRKRDNRIGRLFVYGTFVLLVAGLAYGRRYAAAAPERVRSIEVSKPTVALKAYTEAIHLNPTDSDLYFRRGETNLNSGRFAEAMNDFSKAHALSPDNPRYLVSRALAAIFLRDSLSAKSDIDQLVKQGYQDYPGVHMARGLIADLAGHYDEAIKEYTTAITNESDPLRRCEELMDRGVAFIET